MKSDLGKWGGLSLISSARLISSLISLRRPCTSFLKMSHFVLQVVIEGER